MPGGRDLDDSDGAPPPLSLWQRVLLALPRLRRGEDKGPLSERLRTALVKPVEPGAATKAGGSDGPRSVEELEATVRSADDKERLVGLLLAPVAAAIGIVVISALIDDDPAARRKNGTLNPLHVNPSIYHELELVLLALAVVMLATAFYRKRLFLGIAMALYGLAVFNLHYWGFGIPYILAGAWLLVRSYQAQRDLNVATGKMSPRSGTTRRPSRGRGDTASDRPRPNKRYTPPTAPPKRPPPSKPENEKRAG